MPQALSADLREQVKLLVISGYSPAAIHAQTGVNPVTVSQWKTRHKWRQLKDAVSSPIVKAVRQNVSFTLEQASREAKQALSGVIQRQCSVIAEDPGDTVKQLANTPDGEGRASLVKRIAETASMVYGWDNDKSNTLVVVGLVGTLDPDNQPSVAPVTDIDSTVTPADTTTPSV